MSKEEYFCSESITNVAKNISANIPCARKFSFNIGSAALLVIDMQNCFLDKKYHQIYLPSAKAIIPNINTIIRFFESQNRPIFYTKHVDGIGDTKMMDIWWAEQLSGEMSDIHNDIVQTKENCTIIEKSQYDAFLFTNLDALLKKNNISSVVVVGVMTNLCVETTARSAFMRGYHVFLPADATAAENKKFHEASLLNLAYGFAYLCLTKDIAK